MASVQFGIGNVFFYTIDQTTGNYSTKTVALDNSANNKYDQSSRVLTVDEDITVGGIIAVNDYVVINIADQNIYTFGKVLTTTTIYIDGEADDSLFTSLNDDLYLAKGVSAGLFKDAMITTTSTPVEFKGNNKFNRYLAYTDIEGSVTIGEMILNTAALEYLNGFSTGEYGGGSGVAVMDNQYGESTEPTDVAVSIIKKLTGTTDKYEEVFCHRVSTATLALPFNRNNYLSQDYEFAIQRHSSGNTSIIDYTYEK